MSGYWSRYPLLRGTVFIVTYGRSGSTLLQSVMQSIKGAHIAGENYMSLLPLLRAVRRAREARDNWGEQSGHPNQPWYGAHAIRPEQFLDDCIAAFVSHVLNPPPDARWIGFKEIRYHQAGKEFDDLLEDMRQAFPKARFVFNSRDAGEVSQSRWWQARDPADVRREIEAMDRRFAAFHQRNQDVSVHLNYADCRDNPDGFRPVFNLLEEPFDRKAIEDVLAVKLTH